MKKNNQRGISIVEVIVALGILAVIFMGIFQLVSYSHIIIRKNEHQSQAISLASEAMEAVRFVRDDDWDTFAALDTQLDFHPVAGTGWTLQSDCENIDKFQRCIDINQVYRDDVTGDPVDSGGTLDSDSREVIVELTWTDNDRNYDYIIESYLTNWK